VPTLLATMPAGLRKLEAAATRHYRAITVS
jgi:hypothetical protein